MIEGEEAEEKRRRKGEEEKKMSGMTRGLEYREKRFAVAAFRPSGRSVACTFPCVCAPRRR